MRSILPFVLLIAFGPRPAMAQWAVIDAGNLQQSVTNYKALVEQLSRQATQISNQVRQIQQFETQLTRMGDMATVKNLVGFPEFHADLELRTQLETWADGLSRVNGRGLFGDVRGGIYVKIDAEFPDFDGRMIERNARRYVQPHDVVATVDEFKRVQNDIYARRDELKRAIARTSEAMQAAATEAEQLKLEAVLKAQFGQLAALHAEVELSAAEVEVKSAEAVAMDNAHGAADAEARSRLAQQEAGKISTAFKPQYDCLLQYVRETRFSP